MPELSSTVCIRANAAAPKLYSVGSYWSSPNPQSLLYLLKPLSIGNPLHYPHFLMSSTPIPNLKCQSKLIQECEWVSKWASECVCKITEVWKETQHCLSPLWVWLDTHGRVLYSWWLRYECLVCVSQKRWRERENFLNFTCQKKSEALWRKDFLLLL